MQFFNRLIKWIGVNGIVVISLWPHQVETFPSKMLLSNGYCEWIPNYSHCKSTNHYTILQDYPFVMSNLHLLKLYTYFHNSYRRLNRSHFDISSTVLKSCQKPIWDGAGKGNSLKSSLQSSLLPMYLIARSNVKVPNSCQ